ncbi:hypothetical protein WDU94_003999 [Cyamophila willieti]
MGVESVLEVVASQTGASVPALRLVLSVLLGYPIALIHRHTLYGKNRVYQHLYFILTGLFLGYYNYGSDVIHHIITITTCYAVLYISPGSLFSVAFTFIFTMAYLLIGYYLTSTDSYDIVWTMPECVLVMKLTGLAFNLYDGINPTKGLSKHAQSVALTQIPCPLTVFAHSLFPLTFLIGPHFYLTRYQDFVSAKFTEKESVNIEEGVTVLLGFIYLGVYQVVNMIYSDEFMFSDEYMNAPFWKRSFILGVWGRSAFYKYISVWLLGEGACILSGITYNGVSDSGKSQWNGCANVSLSVFEGATKFIHYVDSFNINTNHWVLENIYKRLKFLGNKLVSQAAVLLFLAVWHGFHSGYYATFFMEFIIIAFEKDFISVLEKNQSLLEFTRRPYVSMFTYMFLKVYTFIFLGYCIAPFALLSYSKWIRVYAAYLFLGHVLFMMWPLYKIGVVRFVLKPQRSINNGKGTTRAHEE